MFVHLFNAFHPRGIAQNYRSRKGSWVKIGGYTFSLGARMAALPFYFMVAASGIITLVEALGVLYLGGDHLMKQLSVPIGAGGALALCFVMLLCMRRMMRAVWYFIVLSVVAAAAFVLVYPEKSFWEWLFYCGAGHFITLAPFYFLAPEALSGQREGVMAAWADRSAPPVPSNWDTSDNFKAPGFNLSSRDLNRHWLHEKSPESFSFDPADRMELSSMLRDD